MAKFVGRRLLYLLPVLLAVTLLTFLIASLLPGDLASTILGDQATPEKVAALRAQMGLDRPLWERLRRDHDFQATTAHGFQGDERDLMIFSIVAASGLHAGAQRFLETERHVFNVALTRARAELRVVGHLSWCRTAPIGHLREFARYVSELASGVSAWSKIRRQDWWRGGSISSAGMGLRGSIGRSTCGCEEKVLGSSMAWRTSRWLSKR